MTLLNVLAGVSVTKLFDARYGKAVVTQELEIQGIAYDSRQVVLGGMFVAIRGTTVDGHRFIDEAVHNGAVAVVMDNDAARDDAFFLHTNVVKIVVRDSRRALAGISANYYGNPSRQLRLVGVTGTNGKTTTTHLLKAILEERGETVGLIGTIQYLVGEKPLPATHTTPESLELNQLLAAMVSKGCSTAVMEVSSHALAMNRVHGMKFSAGVFTNLTQDHLDFHSSMEEYFKAKKMLFDELPDRAYAMTNVDDQYGEKIIEGTKAKTVTYGTTHRAHVRAEDIRLGIHGSEFTVTHDGLSQRVRSSLTGLFNAVNITAAYATGLALGMSEPTIVAGIARVTSVPGRFEQIPSPDGWTAIVDYAHTPDALENCLRAIHEIVSPKGTRKIITIFGCGGNRDRGKRPLMGRIASTMSDITVITSDNPRQEDPQAIIQEIRAGVVSGATVYVEVDRRKAIALGLERAAPGDIVLIAGKGHENYQVVGSARSHFDDREEVDVFIRKNA